MINNAPFNLMVYLFIQSTFLLGQESSIELPNFNDKYSAYVRQLEGGDTEIDYTDFRNSFIESQQYLEKGANYDSLKELVYDEIKNKNYHRVIGLTKNMLSIDYTSMFAHKYLQQTYKILGDTLNRKKYHDIEFGLLYSITRSGDGKSCETGWHVVQIEEEYFILNMLGASLNQQSLISSGENYCDEMVVNLLKGKNKTYYFEINKILEMERKMFQR